MYLSQKLLEIVNLINISIDDTYTILLLETFFNRIFACVLIQR